MYRGLLYSAQNIVKKDPGRARQNSLATAGANITKPGAHNKGDLCTISKYTILATRSMFGKRGMFGQQTLYRFVLVLAE